MLASPHGKDPAMPRSKSDRLRRAESNGAVIKTKGSGETVHYDSKGRSDDRPWKDANGVRYSGSECEGTVPK